MTVKIGSAAAGMHANLTSLGLLACILVIFQFLSEVFLAKLLTVSGLVVITTSCYDIPHNSTLQHGQRSALPHLRLAWPQTAIWAAAGTGYFRSGQNSMQRFRARQGKCKEKGGSMGLWETTDFSY